MDRSVGLLEHRRPSRGCRRADGVALGEGCHVSGDVPPAHLVFFAPALQEVPQARKRTRSCRHAGPAPVDRGEQAQERERSESFEVAHALDRGIQELAGVGERETRKQADHEADHGDQPPVGRVRLLRQERRIEHAELLALPPLLQSFRHLGVDLLVEKLQVVLLQHLVVSREVCELLLGPRGVLDALLELLYAPVDVRDLPLEVLHLEPGLIEEGIGSLRDGDRASRVRGPNGGALQSGNPSQDSLDVGVLRGVTLLQLSQPCAKRSELRGLVSGRRPGCGTRVGRALVELGESLPGRLQARRERLLLELQPLEGRQVRACLLGEAAHASLLELSEGLLLQLELPSRIRELSLDEGDGARHLFLAGAHRFLDEQARQAVGDVLSHPRVAVNVLDRERVFALDVDRNSGAHRLEDVRHRSLAGSLRVGVELRDDLLQPGSAEDLLANREQSRPRRILGRLDERLGNLLLFHEDQRGRPVLLGHREREAERDRHDEDERDDYL